MTYLLLFWEFFKIGLFTFGGGYAMIPLIKDAVISNSWITEEAFTNFIGVCESTPGPVAINMATYIVTDINGAKHVIDADFVEEFADTFITFTRQNQSDESETIAQFIRANIVGFIKTEKDRYENNSM